jgi:hypothetical protein
MLLLTHSNIGKTKAHKANYVFLILNYVTMCFKKSK